MRPIPFFMLLLWVATGCLAGEDPGADPENGQMVFDSASVAEGVEVDSLQTPFEGELIHTLSWKDASGANTLVISGLAAYPLNEDIRRAAFFAYAYARGDSLTASQWELQEVVDSCYCDCAVELAEGPIPVRDVDQDGIAEVFLMYFLNDLCDASPMPTRLTVASGKNLYPLEGYTRRFLAPDLPGVTTLTPGSTFGSASPAIQKAAYQFWEDYLRKEQAAFEVFQKEGEKNKD